MEHVPREGLGTRLRFSYCKRQKLGWRPGNEAKQAMVQLYYKFLQCEYCGTKLVVLTTEWLVTLGADKLETVGSYRRFAQGLG